MMSAKEGIGKQPFKKKLRKGDGGPDIQQETDAPTAEADGVQHPTEGWTEVGGLNRGSRREAARNAKEASHAREAAAKEAAAAAKLQEQQQEQQKGGPARAAAASAAAAVQSTVHSGGIKITRRAHPAERPQQDPADEHWHAIPPEFLIPDDSMLKPLHKVVLFTGFH